MRYLVKVGCHYPNPSLTPDAPEIRLEPGTETDAIPQDAAAALLEMGAIEPVGAIVPGPSDFRLADSIDAVPVVLDMPPKKGRG